MASTWQSYINGPARDLLWQTHAEVLTVRLDGSTSSTLQGIWKRIEPNTEQSADNQGLIGYLGQARFVVKKADLADITNLARAEIDREGETWAVRHSESQDQWTWVLHLSRKKQQNRKPANAR